MSATATPMKSTGALNVTAPTAREIVPARAVGAPRSRLGRRIGALAAGLFAIVILSHGTDAVLHATGVFPPPGQPMSDELFLLAAAYRLVHSILGCYIAARLAPDRPMRHALGLGALGFVVSTVATLATWNKGPELGPKWYPISLVVTAIPCAWAGGKLGEAKRAARADG